MCCCVFTQLVTIAAPERKPVKTDDLWPPVGHCCSHDVIFSSICMLQIKACQSTFELFISAFYNPLNSIILELTERNVCVGVWVCLDVPKTHNTHCYCSLQTLRLYSVNYMYLSWKRSVGVYSNSIIRDLSQNLLSCLPREHFRRHKHIPNMFQKRTGHLYDILHQLGCSLWRLLPM